MDEFLVHDHLRWRSRVLEIGEIGTGDERNAHDREVTGRHDIEGRLVRVGPLARVPFDRERA